jgi:hypothetical protein
MPDSPPPETLAWLRQAAAVDGYVEPQLLLHLLERVEALEQRPIPGTVELAAPTPEAAPVATDEDLYQLAYSMPLSTERGRRRRCYELGRKHGAAAAQPAQLACIVRGSIVRGSDAVITAELEKEIELDKAAKAQPPAPQPAPAVAPVGGLVERVAAAIAHKGCFAPDEAYGDEARAAIREVAAWLDSNAGLPDDATSREADGWEMAAQILNREADR